MAEAAYSPPRQIEDKSVISRTLRIFVDLFFWIFIAVIFNILIELLGIHFNWWDLPKETHSLMMIVNELSWLNREFLNALGNPAETSVAASDWFHDLLFLWKGTDYSDLLIQQVWAAPIVTDLKATLNIIHLLSIRLVVIAFSLPVFLAFGIVALTDGLLQRDLRRFGGGRESSYVWHYAAAVIKPAVILPVVIYLSSPWSIHPNFVVLPFAALFSLSIWISASTFKKYL